jgi:hypothetical protein
MPINLSHASLSVLSRRLVETGSSALLAAAAPDVEDGERGFDQRADPV